MAEDVKIKVGVEGEKDVKKVFESIGEDAEKAGTKASSGINKITKSMTSSILEANLYAKAIGFVVSEAVKFAKQFVEFETALRKGNTLIGVSTEELMWYGKELEQISLASGQNVVGLAEAWYQAMSAGVAVGDSMEFLLSATKLATGGFTDTETAVDTLSSVMNAYKLGVEETTRISDMLIQTQNTGKTTVGQLGGALSNVTPIAASLGIKFEEVAAGLATLTASGTPTAQATTQMRAAMAELSTEGAKAYTNFELLTGQSFPEFIAEGGTMADVFAIMNQGAEESGMSVNNLFGSIEGGLAAMSLGSGGAAEYNSALEKITNSSGATEKANEEMSNTIGYSLKQISASWNALLNAFTVDSGIIVDVFGLMAKYINMVADKVKALNEAYVNFFDTWKKNKKAMQEHKEAVEDIQEGETVLDALTRRRAAAEEEYNRTTEEQIELEKELLGVQDEKIEKTFKLNNLRDIEKMKEDAAEELRLKKEREAEEKRLEKERENARKEAIAAEAALEAERIAELDRIRKEDEKNRQDHEDRRREIDVHSNAVANATYRAMVEGRIKNIKDFMNVIATELTGTLAGKAVEHAAQGVSDLALMASYAARPHLSGLIPVAKESAKTNFTAAAKFGAGAATAGTMASSLGGLGATDNGGSSSTPESPLGGSDDTSEELQKETNKKANTVYVQGVGWLVDEINKYTKDKYNEVIVGR